MTWVTVAVVGGGATLAAGYMGAQAAKEAGATSAAGMRYAADTNREMFDITNRNLAPYREQGQVSLKDLVARMPELTKAYTAEDFAQGIDPGYQFRLAQGQKAAENQYNRGGGLVSGNTMQGMQDYIQGSAAQEFGSAFGRNTTSQTNIFNRLKGIADMGLSATGTTANAATSAGQTIGSAQIGAANAEAAGITGQARPTATLYKAWLTTGLFRCIWADLVGNNHLIAPSMLAELVAEALLAVVSALMLGLGVM